MTLKCCAIFIAVAWDNGIQRAPMFRCLGASVWCHQCWMVMKNGTNPMLVIREVRWIYTLVFIISKPSQITPKKDCPFFVSSFKFHENRQIFYFILSKLLGPKVLYYRNFQNPITEASLLLICLQKPEPKVSNKIKLVANIGHNHQVSARSFKLI